MAAKNRGQLIKEARTAAGMTQEQLARKVKGLSASDISKAERNEIALTNEQVKAIAKATGVTQKSLLEAPVPKKASSGKTSGSSANTMKVSADEKKLIQAYRAADAETQKAAMALLKKSKNDEIGGILGSLINNPDIKDALSGLQSLF